MLNARTQRLLDERKVPYEVVRHRVSFTAQGTAAASHIPGRQFAKVVVAQARPGHPLMVVLPANCHLDLAALAEVSGQGPLALIDEARLLELFPDCEVGAMPAFGQLYGMPVFASACLARCDEVYFNAGSHRETIGMAWTDFVRIVQPKIGDLCREH